MNWHADPDLLDRYAAGDLTGPAALSIDLHLPTCAACSRMLAGAPAAPDTDRLERVWTAVADRVDRPSGLRLRSEGRGVLPDHVLRLIGATPGQRVAWLAGSTLALALAVLAARYDAAAGRALLLLIAPLLPLGAVALSYGAVADPAYEITRVAPASGLRLLLLRALPVTVLALLLGVGADVLRPGDGALVATWLLPALALTTVTLAGATVTDIHRAAVVVGSAWVAGVAVAARDGAGVATTIAAAPRPLFALSAGVGAALLIARRDHLDTQPIHSQR